MKLSKDEEWQVRFIVAQNPNTTIQTLELLLKDSALCVRESSKKNLDKKLM
jgi:hypothetical protein